MDENRVAPACPTCGVSMMFDEDCGGGFTIWHCMYCDEPEEPMEFHYESICWSCGEPIDSNLCQKSKMPGGGWECNKCGADLYDWKVLMGIIQPFEGGMLHAY